MGLVFLVSDTLEERHAKIRGFLNKRDAPIAILLAAADFERKVVEQAGLKDNFFQLF